ncbi:hypothetical protein B9Z55_013517 [Caenorhabditis nigoni]|uniref:SPK domain-containing protein n=1 Tax=Caenorhabditis nigoni TaxID=1611254 RepID=A0A2G5U217_9PELO|nr:hypothetical protein B9Z55_013517 [Caenorhabditis nigoni]
MRTLRCRGIDENSEDVVIWRFVASRIRTPDGKICPFVDGDATWQEFKKSHKGSPKSAEYYAKKFDKVLAPNLEFAPFEDHQKLDLFWALGMPITKSFLRKVRHEYQVTCDTNWYITSYKDMGEHEQWVEPSGKVAEEKSINSQEMWKFLSSVIRDPVTKLSNRYTVSPDTWIELYLKNSLAAHEHYLNEMAPNLHMEPFEMHEKIDLYWALGIVVNKKYLRKLHKHYDLTMGRKGVILVYSKKISDSETPKASKKRKIDYRLKNSEDVDPNDVTDSPEFPHPQAEAEKDPRGRFSNFSMAEIWNFLLRIAKHPETGEFQKYSITEETWQKFREELSSGMNSNKSAESYAKYFHSTLSSKLHLSKINVHDKIALYWSLEIPINLQFIEKMECQYEFKISSQGVLISYTRKSQGERSNWWPKPSVIWDFVLEKSINSCGMLIAGTVDVESVDFWKQFNSKFNINKNPMEICRHFNTDLIPVLEDERLPLEKKLSIFHALKIPIKPEFLKKCQKFAKIKVCTSTGTIKSFGMLKNVPDIVEEASFSNDFDEFSQNSSFLSDVAGCSDAPSSSGTEFLSLQNREFLKNSKTSCGVPGSEFLEALDVIGGAELRKEYENLNDKAIPTEMIEELFQKALDAV